MGTDIRLHMVQRQAVSRQKDLPMGHRLSCCGRGKLDGEILEGHIIARQLQGRGKVDLCAYIADHRSIGPAKTGSIR